MVLPANMHQREAHGCHRHSGHSSWITSFHRPKTCCYPHFTEGDRSIRAKNLPTVPLAPVMGTPPTLHDSPTLDTSSLCPLPWHSPSSPCSCALLMAFHFALKPL